MGNKETENRPNLSMSWFDFDADDYLDVLDEEQEQIYAEKYGINTPFKGWSIDYDMNIYECHCVVESDLGGSRCEDAYDVKKNGIGNEQNNLSYQWFTDDINEVRKKFFEIFDKYESDMIFYRENINKELSLVNQRKKEVLKEIFPSLYLNE